MPYLDRHISINDQDYLLVTERDAQTRFGRRRWQVVAKKQATNRIRRPDVIPGDIDGEWVIVWDDWSRGIGGLYENIPGTVHWSYFVDGMIPGQITANAAEGTITTVRDTNAINGVNPGPSVEFGNENFYGSGRYVYKTNNTIDLDGGAGTTVTALFVHNNELVVAFGSTAKIQTRNTSGTWTAATDDVYVSHFARPENRLWRGNGTAASCAQVSNIGPTDNPRTLANWSSGITVGDAQIGITGMGSIGEQLIIAKPDGIFPGDASTIFDNKLPNFPRDTFNGRPFLIDGPDVYYGHPNGLIRYPLGGAPEEIGIDRQLTSTNPNEAMNIGRRIRALAAQSGFLWAAVEAVVDPMDEPDAVFSTTDNGSTYTSQLANLVDNNMGTSWANMALDTAANGDWFVVGKFSPFAAVQFILSEPNVVAGVRLAAEYWNGSAWTSLGPAASTSRFFLDATAGTALSTPNEINTTFARSGNVYFSGLSRSDWATTTINSVTAYYVRFSFSAAITSSTSLTEVRVLGEGTNPYAASGYLLRGRLRRPNDPWSHSIVWESVTALPEQPCPTVLSLLSTSKYPYHRGLEVFLAGLHRTYFIRQRISPAEHGIWTQTEVGYLTMCMHDAGMPELNKQWLSATIKGHNIDSARTVTLNYLIDTGVSYTGLISATTTADTPVSGNFAAGTTGYAIQPQIAIPALTDDAGRFQQLSRLEIRFRELPTVKDEYTVMLALPVDDRVAVDVALTNLESALAASAVTLIDPVRRSVTVNLMDMQVLELYQSEMNYPALAVQVRMVEV